MISIYTWNSSFMFVDVSRLNPGRWSLPVGLDPPFWNWHGKEPQICETTDQIYIPNWFVVQ